MKTRNTPDSSIPAASAATADAPHAATAPAAIHGCTAAPADGPRHPRRPRFARAALFAAATLGLAAAAAPDAEATAYYWVGGTEGNTTWNWGTTFSANPYAEANEAEITWNNDASPPLQAIFTNIENAATTPNNGNFFITISDNSWGPRGITITDERDATGNILHYGITIESGNWTMGQRGGNSKRDIISGTGGLEIKSGASYTINNSGYAGNQLNGYLAYTGDTVIRGSFFFDKQSMFGSYLINGDIATSFVPPTHIYVEDGGLLENRNGYQPLGLLTLRGGVVKSSAGNATWKSFAFKNDVFVEGAGTTSYIIQNPGSSNSQIHLGDANVKGTKFDVALGSRLEVSAELIDSNIANAATLVATLQPSYLTKTGLGDMQLSAVNTYSGATNVVAGKLIVTGAGSIANSSAVVSPGATLDFTTTDSDVVLKGLSSTGAGGDVLLGSHSLTVTYDGNFAGVLSGNGSLTKTATSATTPAQLAAASLTLAGANIYAGGTIVTGGRLALAATGSIIGGVTVSGEGTFANFATLSAPVAVSGNGAYEAGSGSTAPGVSFNGSTKLLVNGTGASAQLGPVDFTGDLTLSLLSANSTAATAGVLTTHGATTVSVDISKSLSILSTAGFTPILNFTSLTGTAPTFQSIADSQYFRPTVEAVQQGNSWGVNVSGTPAATITWTGGNGTWKVQSGTTWTNNDNGNVTDMFYVGDTVIINTASTVTLDGSNGPIAPRDLLVTSGGTVTLNGGPLIGSGQLVRSGGNTEINALLQNTGGVWIKDGTTFIRTSGGLLNAEGTQFVVGDGITTAVLSLEAADALALPTGTVLSEIIVNKGSTLRAVHYNTIGKITLIGGIIQPWGGGNNASDFSDSHITFTDVVTVTGGSPGNLLTSKLERNGGVDNHFRLGFGDHPGTTFNITEYAVLELAGAWIVNTLDANKQGVPSTLTKTGKGVLIDPGYRFAFSGGLVIEEGTIALRGSNNTFTVASKVVVEREGILLLDGGADGLGWTTDRRVSNLVLNGGKLQFNFSNASATSSGNLIEMTGGRIEALSGTTNVRMNILNNGNILSSFIAHASDTTSVIASNVTQLEIRQATTAFTVEKGTTPDGVDMRVDSQIVDYGTDNTAHLIEKRGAGKLLFTGDNTYGSSGQGNVTGNTTIYDGILVIEKPTGTGIGKGTVNIVNGTFELAIKSANSGSLLKSLSGAGYLLKTENGTLTLGKGGTTFTGQTVLNDGVLVLGVANSLVADRSKVPGPITVAEQKTLRASAGNAIGLVTLNGSTIEAIGGEANWGSFNFKDTVTVPDGKTSTIKSNGAANTEFLLGGFGVSTVTFQVGENATLQLPASLKDGSSSTSSYAAQSTGFEKAGPGTLVLSGISTYTGATFINGGLVNFNKASNFGNGGKNITINGATLQWAAGYASDDGDISPRLAAIGANGATLDTNGNDIVLGSAISGLANVTKVGAGKLALGAPSSLTGTVTVTHGTLAVINYGGSLASAAGVVLDTSADSSVRFEISDLIPLGTATSVTSTLKSLSGGGTVVLGNNSLQIGTLAVSNDGTGTYTGTILGNGSFIKQGTKEFTFNGVAGYTGGTTVAAGKLILGDNGVSNTVLPAAGTLKLAGGELHLAGTIGTSHAATVGAFALTGDSVLSASVANSSLTVSGAADFVADAATLTISDVALVFSDAVTFNTTGGITFNTGSSLAFGGGASFAPQKGNLVNNSGGTFSLPGFTKIGTTADFGAVPAVESDTLTFSGGAFDIVAESTISGGDVAVVSGAALTFTENLFAETGGLRNTSGLPVVVLGSFVKNSLATDRFTLATEALHVSGDFLLNTGILALEGVNTVRLGASANLSIAANTTLEFNVSDADVVPALVLEGGTFDAAALAQSGSGRTISINTGFEEDGTTHIALATGFHLLIDASAVANLQRPFADNGADIFLYNGTTITGFPIRESTGSRVPFVSISPDETGKKLNLGYAPSDTNTTVTWVSGAAAGTSDLWINADGFEHAKNWAGNVFGFQIFTFLDGDSVLFNDSATRRNIQVDALGVNIAGITVTTAATGSSAYVISGPGAIGGTGGLIKNGSGELTLSGANTYAGETIINAGTLILKNTDAAGTGSALTFGASAGTKTLRFDLAADGTFSQSISGPGSLAKNGTGALTLGADALHSGSTTVNTGTLTLAAGVSLSGTSGITLATGTTLAVGFNAHASTSGNVTFSPRAVFTAASAEALTAGGVITFQGIGSNSNAVDITGYVKPGTYIIARAPTITAAAPLIAQVDGKPVPNLLEEVSLDVFMATDLRIAGTAGAGQTLQVQSALIWENQIPGTQHGTFNVASSFTIDADVNYDVVLSDNAVAVLNGGYEGWNGRSLTKTGSGELILAKANAYTGNTLVTAGTLTLNTVASAGTGPSAVNVSRDATLRFNLSAAASAVNAIFTKPITGAGTLEKAGEGEVILPSANVNYTGTVNIGNGVLTLRDPVAVGTGTAPIALTSLAATLRLDTATSAWNFTKPIKGIGALEKTGTGDLTLSAANPEYTGAATVTAGTLVLRDVAALGAAAASATGVRSASVTLATADTKLRLDTPSASQWVFDKPIAGAGTLVKSGRGELQLSYANTYTGVTDVLAGTLTLRDVAATGGTDAATANSAVRLGDATTLRFDLDSAATGTFVQQITGTGSLVKKGEGTLVLPRANTYTGSTSIEAGTLVVRNSTAAGTGPLVAISEGATFQLDTPEGELDGWAFSRVVEGAGELVKSGPGNVVLSGVNTYTGATTVSGGELAITGSLGAGNYAAPIELTTPASILRLEQSGAQVLSGAITGTGALAKTGTGTLTLTGANTYTGETTVSAGTLVISGTLGAPAYPGAPASYGNAIVVAREATLRLDQAETQIFRSSLIGEGTFIKSGEGTLIFSGPVSLTGATLLQAGTLQVGPTHGDHSVQPQTLTLNTLTISPGVHLAYDIYGDYLADKLIVQGISLGEPASASAPTGQIVFDLSQLVGGAYPILESATGFAGLFTNPDEAILTLVNGLPIPEDSLLQPHYTYSRDGKNLILQIIGNDETSPGDPDPTNTRLVRWAATNGSGVWDISSINWRRPTTATSLGYNPSAFQQGDVAVFDTPAHAERTVQLAGPMRVASLQLDGAGTLTLANNAASSATLRGVAAYSITDGDGSLRKNGSGLVRVQDLTLTFDGGARLLAGSLQLSSSTLALPAPAGVPESVLPETAAGTLTIAPGARLVLGDVAAEGTSTIAGITVPGTLGTLVAGTLTVNDGLISGNGYIRSPLVNRGTIAPGFSPGVIVITDPHFDNTQGTIELQVVQNSTTDAADFSNDVLYYDNTTAPLRIDGTLRIDLDRDYIRTHVSGGRVVLPALLEKAPGADAELAGAIEVNGVPVELTHLTFTDTSLYGKIIVHADAVTEVHQDFTKIPGLTDADESFAGVLTTIGATDDPVDILNPDGTVSHNPNGTDTSLVDAILRAPTAQASAHVLQQASPRGLAALTTLPLANAVATTATLRSHLGGIRALRPTPAPAVPAPLSSSARAVSAAPAPAASSAPATNTWLSIAATQTKNGSSSDSPAYDIDAYSAHVGIDHSISENFLLGLALTGQHARADIHGNGGRIKQDEFRATVYGTVTPASFLYVDGTFSAGFSSFDSTRNVTGNFTPDAPDLTTVRSYTSDTDGIDYVATLTAGTNLNLSENVQHRLALHPWLGVEFAHARADAFEERSGGAYAGAYHLDSQSQDSLLLRVGATLEYQTRVASKPLRLALTLSYGRELLDTEVDLRANFLGYSQNTRFEQTAVTTPEDILQITPQVEFQFTKALSVQVSYTFDMDFADRTAHHLSAGVNWRF